MKTQIRQLINAKNNESQLQLEDNRVTLTVESEIKSPNAQPSVVVYRKQKDGAIVYIKRFELIEAREFAKELIIECDKIERIANMIRNNEI